MTSFLRSIRFALLAGGAFVAAHAAQGPQVLAPAGLARHVEKFNAMEDEPIVNLVPNAQAAAWLQQRVPLFECPDADIEEIYYFRWWALRKHLREAGGRKVFTEFINRAAPVSSALGHHLMEGRWLRDGSFHDDYVRFWLRAENGQPHPNLHRYSQWLADALYQRWLVNGDTAFLTGLLDDLVADYRTWEKEKLVTEGPFKGLFWQFDVRDAMEESISGSRTKKNVRPTLNSYMYGNARAIAAIARLASQLGIAAEFEAKAAALRKLTQETLWNPEHKFFEVRLEEGPSAQVREEIGFIPWYFSLPEPGKGYEAAWAQLTDEAGFKAPFGITTAERRHPQFRTHGVGTCEWDGAVWPFATSQTLVALGHVLRDYPGAPVTARDYFDAFKTYAKSHRWEGGMPYLGEYLDEKNGAWLKGPDPRSRWYNHSTFADLLITGVVGLRPRTDDTVEIFPLLPAGTWAWFALDGVSYHGRTLTILWDQDGTRYRRGRGLVVLADGKEIGRAPALQRLTARLAP